MRQVPTFLNPLDLPSGDKLPSVEDTLKFMCTPGVPSDPASVRKRYQAITAEQPLLFAPPAEDRILSQLIWPLRHAKASYVVGNYLGTIALAGIVAEMTAILLFELAEPSLNGKPMTDTDQERVFGRTFEKLGQERRIDVLRGYQNLTQDAVDAFGRVRGLRRQHLHLSQLLDEATLARDARQVFRDAVFVVGAVIGQEIKDGKLVLTPPMMRYLERAGKAPPSGSQEGTEDSKKGGA